MNKEQRLVCAALELLYEGFAQAVLELDYVTQCKVTSNHHHLFIRTKKLQDRRKYIEVYLNAHQDIRAYESSCLLVKQVPADMQHITVLLDERDLTTIYDRLVETLSELSNLNGPVGVIFTNKLNAYTQE